jgi:hypothetical protein
MLLQFVYNSVYYYHFMGKATTIAAVKATAVSLCAVLCWIFLSGSLVGMYIRTGFGGSLH